MLAFSRRLTIAALIAAGAAVVPLASAQADDPTLLGGFNAWSAFSNGTGDGKVCYALAQPSSKQPAKIKRDPVYFLINDWPRRNAKGEPEVVPGYQYKDNSKVTVQVGSDKFDFFTKNEDGVGGAWVERRDESGPADHRHRHFQARDHDARHLFAQRTFGRARQDPCGLRHDVTA